jgi:hypothetical protein
LRISKGFKSGKTKKKGVGYCVPLRLTIYEHAVIEGIQSRFFFRMGSFKPAEWGDRLIHRSAYRFDAYRFAYWIRSNTAPAFAARPCASLKRAWRSTCECLSCTLCSPGGVASAACTALNALIGYDLMRYDLMIYFFEF